MNSLRDRGAGSRIGLLNLSSHHISMHVTYVALATAAKDETDPAWPGLPKVGPSQFPCCWDHRVSLEMCLCLPSSLSEGNLPLDNP